MIALIAIVFCFLSLAFLGLANYPLGLLFSLLSFITFAYHIKTNYGYNSLFFLFLVFFGLYGYSIPVSIFFNLDIGWYKVAKFFYWDKIDPTLFSYLIANQIALLAMIVANEIFSRYHVKRKETVDFENNNFFALAIIAGLCASFFEGLNFFRVGGLAAVNKGKAFYQSAVNDLVLNIPVDGFFFAAIAFFGLYFFRKKTVAKRQIMFFVLAISFYLLVNVLIGERGALVVAGAVIFLGYGFVNKLKFFRLKWVAFLGISFILFNVLTVLREPDNNFKGVNSFVNEHANTMIYLMNPSNTEFGAAAYNYRLFTSEEFEFKKGVTYLEILISPLPTYIYPNKPQSILYEYRDKFNNERKEQGSTAGTGFSSLLEAYLNFSYFGPFLIYFILIAFVVFLEKIKNKGYLFFDVYYLLFFNILLIFSRSVSNYLLFTSILYCLQIFFVLLIFQFISARLWREKR